MVSAKRKRADEEPETSTPRKLRNRTLADDELEVSDVQTPSRRARGRLNEDGTPRSILKKSGIRNGILATTPKSNRRLVFETPSKPAIQDTPNGTPVIVRNADRSARRKSNRKLIERAINGADSDEEDLEEEQLLAQQILSDDEDSEESTDEAGVRDEEDIAEPETPSKRGRGRQKGTIKKLGRPRKKRSPSPLQDLPPHEEYFWQNRPGGAKTSNNALPSQSILNHDEYFQAMQTYADPHRPEKEFLLELHGRAFDQWLFEFQEGFNICCYGYGSKRPITDKFAAHIYQRLSTTTPYKNSKKTPKVVIINGYAAGTTIKEVLTTVASTITSSHTKLPNKPTALLSYILDCLTENPPPHPVPIIINSIDSPYLRKGLNPSLLASLAAHPSINLLCTADTPNFPLMWDVGLKAQYRFLFHDATTFASYDAEIDVVESVNELLGRSGKRIGGRDGVAFVLKSLPENARNLFRILVTEQLALLLMDGADGDPDEPSTLRRSKATSSNKDTSGDSSQGIEYRVLYHKAVEDFVCSGEVAFRTLLKEFHDHQMIESRKDAMGTERLWVPFRLEDLEGLAEDLCEDAS
ncbi:ORC2-domain-containing protein [Lophiostoma macrostomum CBS 122681]|uniref:Origin recognition complex subunit 2 n=1 Tax=Lophiostoma macrostomum CBS 122681 TaxID=1314788 RepID=A0A6A6TEK9_9PLEO|nr:ORC2-domain-containing protein [Lophiostoma macrostomum CBS 122681]